MPRCELLPGCQAPHGTRLFGNPFLGYLLLASSHAIWRPAYLSELGEEGLSLQELLADGAAPELDASHSLEDPAFACFGVATACRAS